MKMFDFTLIYPNFDVESIGDGPRVPRAHLEVVLTQPLAARGTPLYDMTTHTIQTSQHTHKCAPAPIQLLPRGAPAAEEPLTTRLLPLLDLQRLALLAARVAQLVELLLQSADEVGACAHLIGLGFSAAAWKPVRLLGRGRLGGR